MNNKVGRNDPCPCGSGKKYKSCCLLKTKKRTGPKKFAAKVLSTPKPVNLIERTFGKHIEAAEKDEKLKGASSQEEQSQTSESTPKQE